MNIHFKHILIALILLFSAIGCCKDSPQDATDYEQLYDNIVGTWDVTQFSSEIRADTIADETTTAFDITFYEDGTGVGEPFAINDSLQFAWLLLFEPNTVLISSEHVDTTLDTNGNIFYSRDYTYHYYEVMSNTPTQQTWQVEIFPPDGIIDKFIHRWEMEKR
ncbi:MAG: hypothetical protein R2798_03675 [Chitinophagales bacterium]|nr:hypothetical protein [Bacteroidota bacterium]MCB9043083.1 hypothetical protein [Chitinophagales bacterium]